MVARLISYVAQSIVGEFTISISLAKK